MKSDPQLMKDWYKSVKAASACFVCERLGAQPKAGNVEFHHVDADSKRDCISNIVYKNIIFPDMYGPVVLAVEFMKVAPLCPRHHRGLHKAEEEGDDDTTARLYNLSGDPAYRLRTCDFQDMVLNKVPMTLMPQISEGMLAMMEENKALLFKPSNDNRRPDDLRLVG